VVLVAAGKTHGMHVATVLLLDHVSHSMSLALARFLVAELTPRHVQVAELALAIDGTFGLLEGWALHHRFRWAPWLVLVTTGALLPFEVVFLARGIKTGRLIVFAINVAILVYVAWRTRREYRDRATGHQA
jgi:uncharacterized membrane protein (DUF2068 family)